jgi:predicted O-methyltransferase YrrM
MNAKAACLLKAFKSLPPGSTVAEIGCARFAEEMPSDGASTLYLARTARKRDWDFHAVDRDLRAVANARELTAGLPVTLHCADGEKWLRAAPVIDGLYLDGSSSPDEALGQYRAAHLASNAVIAVDDVQPIGEIVRGKGDLLLDELACDGFSLTVYETEPGYRMAVAKR